MRFKILLATTTAAMALSAGTAFAQEAPSAGESAQLDGSW